MKHLYKLFVVVYLLNLSCIEEIDFQQQTFESALVIEATITNELKNQEILLSRTFMFEEDGPILEEGATVQIMAEGIVYDFIEIDPGRYLSSDAFSAIPNVDYNLSIQTANGRSYFSGPSQLTASVQIDELYAVRETNDDGVNGITLYLDSYDPTAKARFFKYTFNETFKIIAPDFTDKDLFIPNDENIILCPIALRDRPAEQKICYRSESSVDFSLTATNLFTTPSVKRFPVHFLNKDNYKISHRYSILIKQYSLSEEVYNYLKILKSFASEGSLLSQLQYGYVPGNIISTTDSNEMVIGFFEVSSISEKRLFFNYHDLFPNEPLPPYIYECDLRAPISRFNGQICTGLTTVILNGTLVYKDHNNGELPLGGPYLMVVRPCGDCTALGSPTPPEFWTE